MIRTQIQLTEAQARKLRVRAREKGVSLAETIRRFVDRGLEEEKAAIAADIREVYAQAKSQGFDPKVMRQVYQLRKMDNADREEQEQLLDIYKHAIGLGPAEA